MSDDRLARIEGRLEELVVGQAELRTEVGGLRGDVAELKEDVGGLKVDVAELKEDVGELKSDVRRLDSRVDDVQRHMHVLHEDVIDRIKGLAG